MAYRLKTVRYQNSDVKILLQNENGPCPLLAAANALLLKKEISLPTESIRAGVASIDDVVNVLAERALLSETKLLDTSHHLNELLEIFPKLQYGMDVNPKFTQGVVGVEYTSNLTAFDMLSVDLVHGWLLDPQDVSTFQLIGNKTYNELVEVVVEGNEAASQVTGMSDKIAEMTRQLASLNNTEEEEWVNVKSSNEEEEESGVVEEESGTLKDGVSPKSAETEHASEKKQEQPRGSEPKQESSETNDEPVLVDESVVKGGEGDDKGANADITAENVTKGDADAAVTSDTKRDTDGKETSSDAKVVSSDAKVVSSDAKEATGSAAELDKNSKNNKEEEPSLSLDEQKGKLETELAALKEKREKLSTIATNGSLINTFLSSTGHQLTHYGLHELYEYLQEDALCVFFRNNHFATLTKHNGILFLLVSDLGYANVPEVMWEKLDGIDGNTEYVNASFTKPAPQASLEPAPGPSLNPEDVLAQRGQVDADMQLALQLSKHANATNTTTNMDDQEGKLVAAATEASLRTYNGMDDEGEEETKTMEEATVAMLPPTSTIARNDGIVDGCSTQEDSDKLIAMQMQAQMDNEDASLHLARKLQQEERRQASARGTNTRRGGASNNNNGSTSSNCVIS